MSWLVLSMGVQSVVWKAITKLRVSLRTIPPRPFHPPTPCPPPPHLLHYSLTPPLHFCPLSLSRARASSFLFPRSLARSLARLLACLLACFPENLSTRVWLSYVFATHGGPVQISDEERIRVYVFWIPVDGPLHWRIEGLARVWILCLGRGGGGRDSLAGNYIVWS